jgi:hypothetical protein
MLILFIAVIQRSDQPRPHNWIHDILYADSQCADLPRSLLNTYISGSSNSIYLIVNNVSPIFFCRFLTGDSINFGQIARIA